MASTELTDYERERLENIRRNGEMMASLRLHSIAADLSHSSKRMRDEAKSKKSNHIKKPRGETTPIVIRRSLRARGMPPDSKGLDDSFMENAMKIAKFPSPSPSPGKLGPLSMRDAYWGEESDRPLIVEIVRIAKESAGNGSMGRVRVCKDENLSGSVKKEEYCEVGGEEFGEAVAFEADNSRFLAEKEEESEVGREEFDEAKAFKAENSGFSVKKEEKEVGRLEFCGNRVCKVENLSDAVKEEGTEVGGSLDIFSMSLDPKNIVRILSDRISAVRFFPCASSRMIVVGNKLGHLGFWNLDREMDEEGEDGLYRYHPHPGPISGISIQPNCLSKVFTSCYDGLIRLMDAEKEVFDIIYSSDYSIYSLAQRSTDVKSVYFAEAKGCLNRWDERNGKRLTRWSLHEARINTIDFSSANPNLMATSSSDNTACIWDVRSINANKPKSLKKVDHGRSTHSAYFSPSGKQLVTTSFDNTVGIVGGVNFEQSSRIQHNNQTGRWISPFKAIWGWDDSYVFIGNMKRAVDILSPSLKKTIFTLQSPDISAIPCRFDIHPFHVGMLAGATGGGQVYVWTSS